jgi:hypothetical protein
MNTLATLQVTHMPESATSAVPRQPVHLNSHAKSRSQAHSTLLQQQKVARVGSAQTRNTKKYVTSAAINTNGMAQLPIGDQSWTSPLTTIYHHGARKVFTADPNRHL